MNKTNSGRSRFGVASLTGMLGAPDPNSQPLRPWEATVDVSRDQDWTLRLGSSLLALVLGVVDPC